MHREAQRAGEHPLWGCLTLLRLLPTRTDVRELISKLVSGGLSAAVVLLWWPQFFPSDSVTSWLSRGAIWTLFFELLLHSLLPLEAALWETPGGQRLRRRARVAVDHLPAHGSVRHIGALAVVASFAVAVPVALMVAAPPHRGQPKTVAVVRHITEIRRIERVDSVPADQVSAPAQDPVTSGRAKRITAPAGARPVARRPASRPRPQTPARSPQSPTTAHASKPAPVPAQPVASDSTL